VITSDKPEILAPCTSTQLGCWSAEHRCFTSRFDQVEGFAMDLLGDREVAQDWLWKPLRGHNNQAPCCLLSTRAGYDVVSTLLKRLQHGMLC
jgi:putative toxin-antitoxin system antitoxin component (TIGR02293 family)